MTDLKVHLGKISPVIDNIIQQQSSKNSEFLYLKENLTKSFVSLEEKIADHFDKLKTAIEVRKTSLLQELKKTLLEKQAHLDTYIANEGSEKENNQTELKTQQTLALKKLKNLVLSDQLEFWSDKYFRYYTSNNNSLACFKR